MLLLVGLSASFLASPIIRPDHVSGSRMGKFECSREGRPAHAAAQGMRVRVQEEEDCWMAFFDGAFGPVRAGLQL